MINKRPRIWLLTFSSIAAVFALVAACYSLVNPVVYSPSTPEHFMPGTVSQDLMSVMVSVLLLVCVQMIRTGKAIYWLIWSGLLGYLYYAYALYAFERIYNEVFVGYLVIMGCCIYSIITFVLSVDTSQLVYTDTKRTPPRKIVAVLFIVLAVMFAVMWMNILLPAMRAHEAPAGSAIFVMDLSFTLPLLVWAAWLLIVKSRAGDMLAVALLVKLATLGVSVLLGALIAPLFGLPLNASSLLVYGLMGLVPVVLIWPFMSTLTVVSVDTEF